MDYEKNTLEKIVEKIENTHTKAGSLFLSVKKGPLGCIWSKICAIGRFYKNKIWYKFATNKNNTHTPIRVTSVLVVTAFTLWAIPILFGALFQGSLMATTWKNEEIYLTSADEVDSIKDIHSVRGCRNIPCSESDAIYFRVSKSFAHHIYSYVDHKDLFYPEYTASVVAPGVNKCTVKSYGLRIKFLMRGWDLYPYMMDAVCTPYETNQTFTQ
jgi:hypothetical protein